MLLFNRRSLAAYVLIATLLQTCNSNVAMSEIFGGIDFPDGQSSFADVVLNFDPLFNGGPAATNPNFVDPLDSLGVPNYASGPQTGSVSLGNGGLLELLFTNNILTSSGNSDNDLHIFEVGQDVEDTFVAIRPTAATFLLLDPAGDANGDGYFEVGKVFGSTSSIDIDGFFAGFAPGELEFDAVQLIDDPLEGGSGGVTVGADIDSVGAISSVFIPADADFDTDGDVDGNDFLAWQNGFGITTGATKAQGDANGDGDVDGNDFLVWQNEFGSGNGVASAVPEPSMFALALLLFAGLAFGYRRKGE